MNPVLGGDSLRLCEGQPCNGSVEDHYPEGGLGDAVLASLATCRNVVVRKLAVNGVPR